MDITTLLGIILGFLVIIKGIGTESLGNFMDMDSVFITVGGTLCAVPVSYTHLAAAGDRTDRGCAYGHNSRFLCTAVC